MLSMVVEVLGREVCNLRNMMSNLGKLMGFPDPSPFLPIAPLTSIHSSWNWEYCKSCKSQLSWSFQLSADSGDSAASCLVAIASTSTSVWLTNSVLMSLASSLPQCQIWHQFLSYSPLYLPCKIWSFGDYLKVHEIKQPILNLWILNLVAIALTLIWIWLTNSLTKWDILPTNSFQILYWI